MTFLDLLALAFFASLALLGCALIHGAVTTLRWNRETAAWNRAQHRACVARETERACVARLRRDGPPLLGQPAPAPFGRKGVTP